MEPSLNLFKNEIDLKNELVQSFSQGAVTSAIRKATAFSQRERR